MGASKQVGLGTVKELWRHWPVLRRQKQEGLFFKVIPQLHTQFPASLGYVKPNQIKTKPKRFLLDSSGGQEASPDKGL